MTFSIPRNEGQIPIFYNHRSGSGYVREPSVGLLKGGYVDSDDSPLYPFGYGLSYTTFDISNLVLSRKEVEADGDVDITVEVKNTGNVKGDEVVQLYTRVKNVCVTRPVQELKGFKRITLEKGETKKVTFHLSMRQLGYYNENMEFAVEPGTLNIMVGQSSGTYSVVGEVKIIGEKKCVKDNRVYTCPVSVE